MKKLYFAALAYAMIGLISGMFYREFTKAYDFDGYTQLSVLHTHLLALGMMLFLVVLALEKLFSLSKTKWFSLFFWHYNAGLLLVVTMMIVIGMREVWGQGDSAMLSGIAGLGHIIITVGIGFLFVALYERLSSVNEK